MRIPVAYLAKLFAAGNDKVILNVLQRLLDMRLAMRCKETGDPLPERLEYDADTYDKMYRLLGIAKYKDRFNIPKGVTATSHEDMHDQQGLTGYTCPGGV